MIKTAPHSAGQALLIILLVMAVALTIGLSVIARSITDIAISQKEEEAARAFSVAEAGIEQALIGTGTGDVTGTLSLGSFTATRSDLVTSGGKTFVHPQTLSVGESASIWLVGHDSNGVVDCSGSLSCFKTSSSGVSPLKFCWGKPGTETDTGNSATWPALEIMLLYTTGSGDYSTAKVARAAFDPNTTRQGTNGFAAPDSGTCTIGSENFAFKRTINLEDLVSSPNERTSESSDTGPQVVRVRLFYNSLQTHPFGIDTSGNTCSDCGKLPQQGTKILSTGTAGSATRKLEVYKLYADLPSIFDYALFSGTGGIVK